MEFSVRKSGLAVPAEPPKPRRQYGALEVRDDEQREATKLAMDALWDAMELSRSSAFILPDAPPLDAQRKLWRFVGEMLLGSDCQERDVMT